MDWFELDYTSDRSIPFAVDAKGRIRDVEEVPRGLACGCFCPECRGPLVAKKGEVRTHHFAHHDRRECRHALEASLFQMAVEILSQRDAKLMLPGWGDRCGWIREYDLRFTNPAVKKFLREPWVVAPQEVTLPSDLVVRCETAAESSWRSPDLEVPSMGLAIHFLTHRKTYSQRPAVVPRSGHVEVAINLGFYSRIWWGDTCEEGRDERVAEARSARSSMSHWLGKETTGRGLLHHPECEPRRATFQQWAQKLLTAEQAAERRWRHEQNEARKEAIKRWTIPRVVGALPETRLSRPVREDAKAMLTDTLAKDLGLTFSELIRTWVWTGKIGSTVPAAAHSLLDESKPWSPVPNLPSDVKVDDSKPKVLSPSADTADKIICASVRVCGICKGPIDRVLVGQGFFKGKLVEQCANNRKHPMTYLGNPSEIDDADSIT